MIRRFYKAKPSWLLCIVIGLFCFTMVRCHRPEEPVELTPYKITFKWFEGSLIPDYGSLKIGLAWALSSLGADLPQGAIDEGILSVNQTDHIMVFDFSRVGFRDAPLEKINHVLQVLKETEFYQNMGYIELGRFVMLTLNSTYHYYEITEVPGTLREFKKQYPFSGQKVLVVNSTVSTIHREIDVAIAENPSQMAYISAEGVYDTVANMFRPVGYEVLDLMPNGQFRFALYGVNGQLKKGANPAVTAAGKPAKCLWCHEIYIQPFYTQHPVLETADYLSERAFLDIRERYSEMIGQYRASLVDDIAFDSLGHHTWMEKIYQDFMEPSIEQIASEWAMDVDEVALMVGNLPTHTQHEYGIENLYTREHIDALCAFAVVKVPGSDRELSEYEPNFFE